MEILFVLYSFLYHDFMKDFKGWLKLKSSFRSGRLFELDEDTGKFACERSC